MLFLTFAFILIGVEVESNSIYWDGTNNNNQPVSSGIYYYKLVVDNKVIDTKKNVVDEIVLELCTPIKDIICKYYG